MGDKAGGRAKHPAPSQSPSPKLGFIPVGPDFFIGRGPAVLGCPESGSSPGGENLPGLRHFFQRAGEVELEFSSAAGDQNLDGF